MKPLSMARIAPARNANGSSRLRAELLDRPDRHEAPRRRAGSGADERHPEHGAQGVVEVVAPDEMHYSADDAHPANASAGVADRRCGEPHRHGARAVASASEQAAEPAAARFGLGDWRSRHGLRHRLGSGLRRLVGPVGLVRCRSSIAWRAGVVGDAAVTSRCEVTAERLRHLVLVALLLHPSGRFPPALDDSFLRLGRGAASASRDRRRATEHERRRRIVNAR